MGADTTAIKKNEINSMNMAIAVGIYQFGKEYRW